MAQALLIYNLFLFLVTGFLLLVLRRKKDHRPEVWTILLGVTQLYVIFLGAILYPLDSFGKIQLLTWGVFLHFPLFIIGSIFLLRTQKRGFSIFLACLLGLTWLIAGDAFLVEPHWLQISRISISSPKLDESLKVVLLADIQTDTPGPYEANVLALVAAEKPDLLLLAGDYLQISDPDLYLAAVKSLNKIFREAELSPRLGIYATQGNVDWNGWQGIFQGLDVKTFSYSETLDLGPITLTGLGWLESQYPILEVAGSENYHIILGHSPNFSLGEIEGDLLLAGHTHGGQFQLPGIGPLVTASAVP
ncbi:MAG: metallophosphoesterase, partial [Chloroflexi bacterium]|nr:metallophosphoesterase [Chloroflexota bacterium]